MSAYPAGSFQDRKTLESMPNEKQTDFLFLQIRNLWRVDGLYFLGIEKQFGTEAASKIDAEVWETMAAIEAKSLQRMLQIEQNPKVSKIMEALQMSSWALDQPFKTTEISQERAILSIERCRTQETRSSKGLGEFPCKKVRYGYLKSFAQTLNPKVTVNCLFCPPDKHSRNEWCRWEFRI